VGFTVKRTRAREPPAYHHTWHLHLTLEPYQISAF
jgi:hypothetical protein